MEFDKYFERIKDECIQECKSSPLEQSARDMFNRPEVISLFLKGSNRDAHSFIIESLSGNLKDDAALYIPGSGVGDLSLRIIDKFPSVNITQVDSSRRMVDESAAYNHHEKIKTFHGNALDLYPLRKFDAIIAYGFMRYIPEKKRNRLVDSWSKILQDDGIVLIGEGGSKQVIESVHPCSYGHSEDKEKDAKLFRFSLFYHLLKRYDSDRFFQEITRMAIDEKHHNGTKIDYVDILSGIAGYSDSKVYLKILKK